MLLLGISELAGDLRELIPGLRWAADARGFEEIGVVEQGDRAAFDRQVVLLAAPLLMESRRNVVEEFLWLFSDARVERLDQLEIGEFRNPIDLDHKHIG